jgi:hypothetical protein
MSSNKKLISFNCEKNFYYSLIFWTFELATKLLDSFFPTKLFGIKISFDNLDSDEGKLEELKINELINLICKIIAELFAGIVYLCYDESFLEKINKNTKKFFYIMIISIFLIICRAKNFIYYLLSQCDKTLSEDEVDWEIGIYIASTIIFCKYINKEITLYLHHKVSIIITLIAFAFMTSTDIYSIINEDQDIQMINKLIYLILYCYSSIYYPFSNSIFKLLMNDFLSPITIIFSIGIFQTILLLISLPILFFTKLIKLGKVKFDEITLMILWILMKICYIIFYFIRQLMIFKIINKYNPAYMIFMISINSFISFIASFFLKKEDAAHNESSWCIILDCISLTLISFGGLLFNEIIIVHKFGLDQKTRLTLNILANEEIFGNEKEDDY